MGWGAPRAPLAYTSVWRPQGTTAGPTTPQLPRCLPAPHARPGRRQTPWYGQKDQHGGLALPWAPAGHLLGPGYGCPRCSPSNRRREPPDPPGTGRPCGSARVGGPGQGRRPPCGRERRPWPGQGTSSIPARLDSMPTLRPHLWLDLLGPESHLTAAQLFPGCPPPPPPMCNLPCLPGTSPPQTIPAHLLASDVTPSLE